MTARPKRRPEPSMSRERCREIVLRRDTVCRGRGIVPDSVRCNVTPSDVHELGRGQYRQDCETIPAMCVGLCRACHDWVHANWEAARGVGLALKGFEAQQAIDTWIAVQNGETG